MRRGFTLVELIAVMVLLAVLSATALPAVSAISSASVRGAADEVARRAHVARAHAATFGRPAGVVFDVGGNRVASLTVISGVAGAIPLDGARTVEAVDLGSAFPGVAVTAVDAGADGGVVGVWFEPSGEPRAGTAAGPTTAMVRDATVSLNGEVAVTVHRLTGLVTR